MSKRILVAGGAGFIGSALCNALLQKGHQVICLDNLTTGQLDNVKTIFDEPLFKFVEHDIVKPFTYDIDQIYNLACPASPIQYQSDPIQTTKVNILGSLNALDLATRVKARVLQGSTSEVYGDPLQHPQSERYWGNVNPTGPRSCYDEGKRCVESLFFDYRRIHCTEIKVARIFNTYGPRMLPDDGRVVSNFIAQALKGEPLIIFGDGFQTRSFCFVDDLVDGLYRLMNSPTDFVGPLNLGNPEECTINELAALVIEYTGSRSKVCYRPLRQDDPRRRRPDVRLAQKELGWCATTPLREGLAWTIAYFENALSKSGANLTPGVVDCFD